METSRYYRVFSALLANRALKLWGELEARLVIKLLTLSSYINANFKSELAAAARKLAPHVVFVKKT